MTHQIIFDRSVDRCSMQLGHDKNKKERSSLVRFCFSTKYIVYELASSHHHHKHQLELIAGWFVSINMHKGVAA